MPDLLIELFSEEIPARMQTRAGSDLKKLVTDGLVEAGLTYAGASAFTTPRRLTLAVHDLLAQSPQVREERKGPRVDAPQKAIDGFLRGAGVSRDELEIRDEKKGQIYFAVIEKPGRPAAEIVSEVLENAVRHFPWPKSMRWGAGSLRWVRPLHSILCILTDDAGEAQVVPVNVDGIVGSDQTRGHRFLAPAVFSVTSFDDYEAKLKRAKVILNAEERANHIWHEATNLAFANGLEVVEDKGLLTEVAGLVEWPVVLMGAIHEDFLGLPAEVLQTSMKEHQKFFSVRNPETSRIERFVTVANIETVDSGATILAGNQKVLSARLSDAKFFWENDRRLAKEGMSAWLDQLKNVTFESRLGSQADRINRIAALARELAPSIGADRATAEQAAQFAKADLSSEMVYEFPELQGVMGRYYALEAGMPKDVAWAAEEHYSPLGPSDDVPSRPVSATVALADKIDLLTGFWAIDEKPTGSKDPFALRRAALGVIRIILEDEHRLHLDRFIDSQLVRHKIGLYRDTASSSEIDTLQEVVEEIADHGVFGAAWHAVQDRLSQREDAPDTGDGSVLHIVGGKIVDLSADLLSFFHERLKVYLRDQGIRHDVIDACLDEGADDLFRVVTRAKALQDVLGTEDGENLVQGFKRANNILSQAEEKDGVEYSFGADVKYSDTQEETALFEALGAAETKIRTAIDAENFTEAMGAMAGLRTPIDAFFEAVQVNTDNAVVRRNRLNLLSRIRQICNQVADLSKLEG